MKLHIHVGFNTVIGKTLSVILSVIQLYRTRNILVLDMDNFGPKGYSLFRSLDDGTIGGNSPFGVFRIKNTSTYVASLPILDNANSFYSSASGAIAEIQTFINAIPETTDLAFDHVIIDTSHSILNYTGIHTPLPLPSGVSRLKFWINYDYSRFVQTDVPGLFWSAYEGIERQHKSITNGQDGRQRNSLIHVFNPGGFLTEEEKRQRDSSSVIRRLFNVKVYQDLVNLAPRQDNWVDPAIIVQKAGRNIPSFDMSLRQISSGMTAKRGEEIARWWLQNHPEKPLNVVFIPVEPGLVNFRDTWTHHPPHSLLEVENRLGSVGRHQVLKDQWFTLVNC